MIQTITRSMVRKGRIGEDAITVQVPVLDDKGQPVLMEDGTPKTEAKKENPKIEVTNCLPDKLDPTTVSLEDIVTVAGSLETLAKFFVAGWDRFRLSQVQEANQPEADTTYSDFYTANPAFYAKKFAGLEGDDLQKAKTTFARTVSGMAKQMGVPVSDVLAFVLLKG